MSEIYCPICGSKQVGSAEFCQICGTKLPNTGAKAIVQEVSAAQPVQKPQPMQNPQPVQRPQESSRPDSPVPAGQTVQKYDWQGRPVQGAVSPKAGSTETVTPEDKQVYYEPIRHEIPRAAEPDVPKKDSGTAVVGSILFPGFFGFYLGEAALGVGVFLVTLFFLATGMNSLALLVYIGQLIFADYKVKEYNRREKLLRGATPPGQ